MNRLRQVNFLNELKIMRIIIYSISLLLEIIASLWRENPSRDLKTELFVRTV